MIVINEKYKWRHSAFNNQIPDTIVIHHAAARTCTAQDIHKWHLARGWMGIAYHYFIRKDGRIYRGRAEEHTGGGLLGNENTGCVQICLEGCYEHWIVNGFDQADKTVPEAQMTALVELCKDIKSRHKIVKVNRHAQYASAIKDKKSCPGQFFPWVSFLQRLEPIEPMTASDELYGYGVAFGHKAWGIKEKQYPALARSLQAIADNWTELQKVPHVGDLIIKIGQKLNTK